MPQFTQEELLAIRVTGEQEVKRLREEIRLMEEDLVKAYQARDGSIAKEVAWRQAIQFSAPILAKNREEIEKFSEASKTGLAKYGQNMTALGYALNDFFSVSGNLQQRLNAIANNLPGVFAGFSGLGLALGAVVPIIAAAIPALSKFWEEAGGEKAVDALKKRIKELEERPLKLAVDFTELNAAKEKLEALEKAQAAFNAARQTEEEADLARQAGKATRETMGSEALQTAVAGDIIRRGDKSVIPQAMLDQKAAAERAARGEFTAQEEANFAAAASRSAAAGGNLSVDTLRKSARERAQQQQRDIQAQIDNAVGQAAKDRVGQFLTGDIGAIGAVKGVVGRTPDAFPPEFRKAVGMMPGSPEEAAALREARKIEARERRDEAAAERQQKLADAENEQRARDRANQDARSAAARERFNAGMGILGQDKGAGAAIQKRAQEILARGASPEQAQRELQDFAAGLARTAGVGEDVAGDVGQKAALDALKAAGVGKLSAVKKFTPVTGRRTVNDRIRSAQARGRVKAAQRQAAVQRARNEQADRKIAAKNRADAKGSKNLNAPRTTSPLQDSAQEQLDKANPAAPAEQSLGQALEAQRKLNAQLMAKLQAVSQVAAQNAQAVQQDAEMWRAQQFQSYPFNSWLGN